ncbi:MAG: nucleotidyltransferase domain-containing protein [Flavobacteriales bacterium]
MHLTPQEIEGLRSYFATKPVVNAYLFGSFARGEADEKSDVDILVDLDRSVPFGLGFFGMIGDLQEMLGRQVDIVTREALSPHVEPYVKRDLLSIYARPTR